MVRKHEREKISTLSELFFEYCDKNGFLHLETLRLLMTEVPALAQFPKLLVATFPLTLDEFIAATKPRTSADTEEERKASALAMNVELDIFESLEKMVEKKLTKY
jgi:hypothetical protein